MKSKYLNSLLLFLTLLSLTGCFENPIEPDNSVEQRINSNRPFNEIVIYHSDYTYVFSKYDEDAWNRIYNAFADDRYFIVITDGADKKTYYFNLYSIRKLETQKGIITISY